MNSLMQLRWTSMLLLLLFHMTADAAVSSSLTNLQIKLLRQDLTCRRFYTAVSLLEYVFQSPLGRGSTLLVPADDSSITQLAAAQHQYIILAHFHILRCNLTFHALNILPVGTWLPTRLSGHGVRVTHNSAAVTELNFVVIVATNICPGLAFLGITCHGIGGVLYPVSNPSWNPQPYGPRSSYCVSSAPVPSSPALLPPRRPPSPVPSPVPTQPPHLPPPSPSTAPRPSISPSVPEYPSPSLPPLASPSLSPPHLPFTPASPPESPFLSSPPRPSLIPYPPVSPSSFTVQAPSPAAHPSTPPSSPVSSSPSPRPGPSLTPHCRQSPSPSSPPHPSMPIHPFASPSPCPTPPTQCSDPSPPLSSPSYPSPSPPAPTASLPSPPQEDPSSSQSESPLSGFSVPGTPQKSPAPPFGIPAFLLASSPESLDSSAGPQLIGANTYTCAVSVLVGLFFGIVM